MLDISLVENKECRLVEENGKTRRMYVGSVNDSTSGPCLKWTEVDHGFVNITGIGDDNYCRNPDGNIFKQEICITDNGTAPCDVQTCGKIIKCPFP